jgi:CRISPR-associated protein Csb3
MSNNASEFRIRVDVTNPGQFFACCGLLELTERLSGNAEGVFESGEFYVRCNQTFEQVMEAITTAQLNQLDMDDATSSPIGIGGPFKLRLDWWKRKDRATAGLKLWAGTMESFRIARAMQQAMRSGVFQSNDFFNVGTVAYDPDDLTKKVEPFYFDARRGPNAHSRDVGFSPNDLGLTTTAFPAVEFLCLVGLQRCQPVVSDRVRIYNYHTWSAPLPPLLLPAAVAGLISPSVGYRFESWFRTGQKKHKAFLTAKLNQ